MSKELSGILCMASTVLWAALAAHNLALGEYAIGGAFIALFCLDLAASIRIGNLISKEDETESK